MIYIVAAEEEITRWDVPTQQEATAGKGVEQEYVAQVNSQSYILFLCDQWFVPKFMRCTQLIMDPILKVIVHNSNYSFTHVLEIVKFSEIASTNHHVTFSYQSFVSPSVCKWSINHEVVGSRFVGDICEILFLR